MTPVSRILIPLGVVCIAIGCLILIFTFYPVIKLELTYDLSRTLHQKTTQNPLTPVDTAFGIVIPKLGANARIIANVDPYNASEYQQALTKGVAHAKGTAVPGEPGNIFLFSHSSVNFYVALQYNSVFYLINKLEAGDQIILYYHNMKYGYRVTGKKFVGAKDVSYLTAKTTNRTLTLMTCWPPGTTYERLLVLATLLTP